MMKKCRDKCVCDAVCMSCLLCMSWLSCMLCLSCVPCLSVSGVRGFRGNPLTRCKWSVSVTVLYYKMRILQKI